MAHVLVIDDDPLFREITAEMLSQDGHTVDVAENGIDASRELARPDVAIVDMLMPERDGIETIGDLKKRWPGMRIVGVSSGSRVLGPELLLRTAKAVGADVTMAKPVTAEALGKLIRSLVG